MEMKTAAPALQNSSFSISFFLIIPDYSESC